MYVERLLQINMATVAALASLLEGMGQHSPIMPLGMMVAAMLSVWLTDFTGWFALSRTVAGLASIGALAASRFPGRCDGRRWRSLVAVADFLVYVQAIHLFQRKTPRIYWALIRFSVLQVVVAALLVQGAFFGMLLVVYLFTVLSALALLFLHCERLRHPGLAGLTPARSGPRWPLAGQIAEFASRRTRPSRGAGRAALAAPADRSGDARLERSGLLRRPRIGQSVWRRGRAFGRCTPSASPTRSPRPPRNGPPEPGGSAAAPALRPHSNEPYAVHGEIYLRGAMLTAYAPRTVEKPGAIAVYADLLDGPPGTTIAGVRQDRPSAGAAEDPHRADVPGAICSACGRLRRLDSDQSGLRV